MTCGKKVEKSGDLQAHEEWTYDTTASPAVARISQIVLQCRRCHDCEHFFRTQARAKEGKLPIGYINDLIQHFCAVNGVDKEEFDRHQTKAWHEWRRRSALSWDVDLRPYSEEIIHAEPPKESIDDKPPSKVSDRFWLWASRKTGAYPANKNSGKWLIFVPDPDVDEVWAKIKAATEQGLLGDSAKVATAKKNPHAIYEDRRVICVYTYDWMDAVDVRRVREQLRTLGIKDKISYKTDSDTLAGKYSNQGQRVAKYYE